MIPPESALTWTTNSKGNEKACDMNSILGSLPLIFLA